MVEPISRGGHFVVLVVDDEPLILIAAAECLREAGLEVHEASTSADALHFLDTEAPAAIVTDIDLPGHINGFGLGWHAHSQGIGVVFMSGRVAPTPEMLPPNAQFLVKPVADEKLIASV